MKTFILILSIWSSLGLCQSVNQTIVYGTDNVEQQSYDIYFPTIYNESTPIVIFIHGGNWSNVNRQRDYYYQTFLKAFVESNIHNPDLSQKAIFVNLDYRLLIENNTDIYVLPDQIDDIHLAINSLCDNFNLCNNPITLMGNSAGGHLAMWYFFNNISPISKVIPITAPYTGEGGYFENGTHLWVQNQFVDPSIELDSDMTISQYASPRTWRNQKICKIFPIFGDNDPIVPISQYTDFFIPDHQNLTGGAPFRHYIFNGNHRGWLLFDDTGSLFYKGDRVRIQNFVNLVMDFITENPRISDYYCQGFHFNKNLSNLNSSNFSIYPNPVIDKVHIKSLDENITGTIIIKNFKGDIIETLDYKKRINLIHLEDGIYYMIFNTENFKETIRFIKQ